ncbi:MAG: adenylyl-sulfate reductase subunit beta [Acidimicrobiia bacterium]
MPTFVHVDKCDGCRALERPACMYICPNDLMALDVNLTKGYNQEPDLCWECYSCVKVCPQGAIEMRGYADVMPMGSRVTPLRGTDSIMWAIQYRNGEVKRFKYPIRTTAWGSINGEVDLPVAVEEAGGTQLLAGEPQYLLVDALPALPTN